MLVLRDMHALLAPCLGRLLGRTTRCVLGRVDAAVTRREARREARRARRAKATVRMMTNLHRLRPCAVCSRRMAVPGSRLCTICDAVSIPTLVPDDPSTLFRSGGSS
jgi:hypothetical protein